MARFAHASDFCTVSDCFARQEAARILGVAESTVERWRSGLGRVPWAAYRLLYEVSKYGIAERDSLENFQRSAILGEREALRQRVAQLEAALAAQAKLVDWRCANDPFIQPHDPRSKVVLDSPSLML